MPFLCPAEFDIAGLLARFADQGDWGQIVGAHGSGKSTLLAALAASLRAAGHAVTLIELHDGERRLPADWSRGLSSRQAAHQLNANTDDWKEYWQRQWRPRAASPGAPSQGDESIAHRVIVIVDGYEQLNTWHRAWLKWRCRWRAWGLLVTAHHSVGLPTLCEIKVDESTARRVVQHLLRDATDFQPGDISPLLAAHDDNLREVLFDLYDRYERQRVEHR